MSRLISLLSATTGLNEHDIRGIVATAPARYCTYKIAKRSGGTRLISQPARELKALQRILATEILNQLPVHAAATAYRVGGSIRDNAAVHAGSGPIFKYDFANFFPSIKAHDWRNYCKASNIFDNEVDLYVSTQVFFQRRAGTSILQLAIGAPSSPILSNILMNEFDNLIIFKLSGQSVKYTRYADDMTFSAERAGFLNSVDQIISQSIKQTRWPKLQLNLEKTVKSTQKYKRMVTGLILAVDGRVTIGHERKRAVRSTMHRYGKGLLTQKEAAALAGMLAFINDVEPSYFRVLEEQHGSMILKLKSNMRNYKREGRDVETS